MNKHELNKKSQPMQNLMQSRNRGYDSQIIPKDSQTFCAAEFETDPSILQINVSGAVLIDDKAIGTHLVHVANESEFHAYKSCLSKQTENRIIGTDEKTISLYAQDFDLSNTI